MRDYGVTSLYLLTGDTVTPDLSRLPPLDPDQVRALQCAAEGTRPRPLLHLLCVCG